MKIINLFGHFLLDILETIVIAGVVFAIFYFLIAQPHQVQGDSMFPNLKTSEFILTNKLSLRFNELERGDIIVFKYPRNQRVDYIKRIIALPNEEIMIKNNEVFIFNNENPSGFKLEEDYLTQDIITTGRVTIQEGQKFLVDENSYVVFGDNRERSSDSREWGIVNKDLILGKAWIRYWPPQSFAKLSEI